MSRPPGRATAATRSWPSAPAFGLTAEPWRQIRFPDLARRYLDSRRLTHHALEDAQLQAELFRAMMASDR